MVLEPLETEGLARWPGKRWSETLPAEGLSIFYIFEYHFICNRPGKRQEGFCVSFIYSIYLYFNLVHVYPTFCRVFSPKFATRKMPLFRNGGDSGSIVTSWPNLQIVVTSFRIVIFLRICSMVNDHVSFSSKLFVFKK